MKLIFDRMPDEGVVLLVRELLSDERHRPLLSRLHFSFDKKYWSRRYERTRRTCSRYDRITPPTQIGLLQYYQLTVRRQNIIKKRSPFQLLPRCKQMGNRYYIGTVSVVSPEGIFNTSLCSDRVRASLGRLFREQYADGCDEY